MAQLFSVIVRCPATDAEIDTGIRTSGREVLSSNIYQNGRVLCNRCKQFHSFDECAFLRGDSPSPADALWRPNPQA
jgi:hypothetical protein